jgi:hypothetical protein
MKKMDQIFAASCGQPFKATHQNQLIAGRMTSGQEKHLAR